MEITVLVIISGRILLKLIKERGSSENEEDRRPVEHEEVWHLIAGFFLVAFIAVCIKYIPVNLKIVRIECGGRTSYNKVYEALDK